MKPNLSGLHKNSMRRYIIENLPELKERESDEPTQLETDAMGFCYLLGIARGINLISERQNSAINLTLAGIAKKAA